MSILIVLSVCIAVIFEKSNTIEVSENNSLPGLIGFLPILLIILVVLIIGIKNDSFG